MTLIESDVGNRSFLQLLNTTRRFLGDTSTNTSNQRWSDHEVYESICFELSKMWNEIGLVDHAAMVLEDSMTYTGGALYTQLPEQLRTNVITKILNLTSSSTSPVLVRRVSLHELDSFGLVQDNGLIPGHVWARQDTFIRMKPVPTADQTLAVYHIHAPYNLAFSSTSDDDLSDAAVTSAPMIHSGHEELAALGAAMRLKRVDGEATDHEHKDYAILWDQFVAAAKKYRGPRYPRSVRRWR